MTQPPLKLLCVFAHPDDETLGSGGTLARYAAEDIETYVITATRGQRGWLGNAEDFPGADQLGAIREQELRAAAKALNITELILLDYWDGELDQADSVRLMHELTGHIRRIRPEVVVTFDPFGAYGHPDHIAISQSAAAAVACAADSQYIIEDDSPPFVVSKLYYLVTTKVVLDLYQQVFGDLVMTIEGQERRGVPWPEWSVTTRIDISSYRDSLWQAVTCHQTQIQEFGKLLALPQQDRERLWQYEDYYRVFSCVPSSEKLETDLFSGLYPAG